MDSSSWDDFANNLATDLAPLITLFGEQVTKQYLSESISTLDVFIFALCPLGVLTAIVSAIRVVGSPEIRAFIGRAQEGPGAAELELLSCTSRTTVELWNDNSISRVFGDAEILEVLVTEPEEVGGLPRIEFLADGMEVVKKSSGLLPKFVSPSDREAQSHDLVNIFFVSNPNISLNKGIKRRAGGWYAAAASLGMVLTIGHLVYAAFTVYVKPQRFMKNGKAVEHYAFPCFCTGTILLNTGMFLCAMLVEGASSEVRLQPKQMSASGSDHSTNSPRTLGRTPNSQEHVGGPNIYWIQPGFQKIGDQVFGSFMGRMRTKDKPSKLEYVKSIRRKQAATHSTLWFAIAPTISGFVLQFVGARALHASVTMALLGSTLIMSFIRAALRTQRMSEGDNLLLKFMDKTALDHDHSLFRGHELECFAHFLHAGQLTEFEPQSPSSEDPRRKPRKREGGKPLFEGPAWKLFQIRVQIGTLTDRGTLNWKDSDIRLHARNLHSCLEELMASLNTTPSRFRRKDVFEWTIELETYVAQGSESITSTRQAFYLTACRKNGVWSLEYQQIEALLGLWAFSLTCTQQKDAKGKWYRKIYLRKVTSKDDVDSIVAGEMKMWPMEMRVVYQQQEDPKYCGGLFLYEREERMTENAPAQGSDSHEIDVLAYTEVGGKPAVVSIACQAIYTCFLQEVLVNHQDITLDTEIDKCTTMARSTPDNSGPIFIKNKLWDAWAEIFERWNVGTRIDGLSCVVATLYCRPRHCRVHGGLPSLRNLAATYGLLNYERFFNSVRSQTDSVYADMTFVEGLTRFGDFRLKGRYKDDLSEDRAPLQYLKIRQLIPLFDHELVRDLVIDKGKHDVFLGWESVMKRVEGTSSTITAFDTTHSPSFGVQQVTEILRGIVNKSNDSLSEERRKAMLWAAENRYTILFYLLTDRNQSTGILDSRKLTHLAWAAGQGHCPLVNLLLEFGADTDPEAPKKDASGASEITLLQSEGFQTHPCTPLALASAHGHRTVASILISAGADIEAASAYGVTSLMIAAKNGHLAIVRLLVDEGVDVEAKDHRKTTSLMLAAEHGHLEVVQLLVSEHANIDARDYRGTTSLMFAASSGHLTTVRSLLLAGATFHFHDIRIELMDNEAMLRCLVENSKYSTSQRPSRISETVAAAIVGRKHNALTILIKRLRGNVDVDWRHILEMAIKRNNMEAGEIVLSEAVDFDNKRDIIIFFIWKATSLYRPHWLDYVIKKYGVIHAVEIKEGLQTAFIMSTEQGSVEGVQSLLDRAVDCDWMIEWKGNKTILEIARGVSEETRVNINLTEKERTSRLVSQSQIIRMLENWAATHDNAQTQIIDRSASATTSRIVPTTNESPENIVKQSPLPHDTTPRDGSHNALLPDTPVDPPTIGIADNDIELYDMSPVISIHGR